MSLYRNAHAHIRHFRWFGEIMSDREIELLDLAEAAWGIIAFAGNGNWRLESAEWQLAAARWRERYHAAIGVTSPPEPKAAV